MAVGWVQIEIVLPEAASLKDRRQVVRSVKDRLRRQFNVSVAELDPTPDLWQRATLGIAAINADPGYLLAQLEQAAAAAERMLAGQDVRLRSPEILN
ncbi:MAG TPA: DUF503 domain-containing protein [Terriglobales bacterium]|nr:DUF503 domain-containing protein [Terriglobales bacterium]